MRSLLIDGTAAVAALAMAPAIAQTGAPAQPAPVAKAAPTAKVHTRAEVQTRIAEHFARMDSDRDGFVTKAEAESARAQVRTHVRERFAERREERRGEAFERLDTNNDGAISRQEFEAAPVRQERRIVIREKAGGERGGHAGMHHMGMAGFHGRMFEMADADKDGRVSLQEAQAAALRHFDMADSNRDGQITREERMQMRRHMRERMRSGAQPG